MSRKTPEQAAEEYSRDYRSIPGSPGAISKHAFLAGRKHFIENELREYLEMAREVDWDDNAEGGCVWFGFSHSVEEIINKAKED